MLSIFIIFDNIIPLVYFVFIIIAVQSDHKKQPHNQILIL